jgi:hypothetical protein
MTTWIIIGGVFVYALVLLAFNRLGGLRAAADGLQDWGCAVSELCPPPAPRK